MPELQALLHRQNPSGETAVWRAAGRFYAARGLTLAWSDSRPTPEADAAIAGLTRAEAHGLNRDSYHLAELAAMRPALARPEGPRDAWRAQLARFDLDLTLALLSAGRDVAIGHADPRGVDPRWRRQRVLPDLASRLAQTREDGLTTWLDDLAPQHPGYQALRRALGDLRFHQAAGGWPLVGQAAERRASAARALTERVHDRLRAGGEWPRSAPVDAHAMAIAVKVFQEHQGLPATGRLDRATLAALDVPLSARISQVLVNLERWRWLPDDLGARYLWVNIPQFYLEAYEGDRAALAIRAIVGKPDATTPVFSSRMTQVVLSPYWNIPETIVSGETLPSLASDPAFLARNNIEVVRVSGRDAEPVDPASLDWSDETALQGLSFRQRPGAANALGLVKFVFPNPYDVYVHDTPADHLFARIGRTLSHGCVRVEDPRALTRYVLRDQPQWTPAAIESAMEGGIERPVTLTEPLPIHIVYFTAWVDAQGGLHFRDDVYGYDQRQKRDSVTAVAGGRSARLLE
jgi:murein L,D-transpeptidase YcbB/YkuD